MAAIVEVKALVKRFGGIHALRGVDLHIDPGEVLGLVGGNGAGKSTLIKILAGLEQPDSGTLLIDGRPATIPDTAAALRHGLSFIHQELNLVGQMSVLQNLGLGLPQASRAGFFDRRGLTGAALPVVRRLGIDFALDRPVASLSTAQKWLVAIAHALLHASRLIVMDEPTASLSSREADTLMAIVRQLSADGVAILYVSHRLDEILALCHRVIAFRDGSLAMQASRAGLDRGMLVEAVVGHAAFAPARAPALPAPALPAPARIPALARTGGHGAREAVLSVDALHRARAVRGVSFTLFAGEVLGLAGLVGAGRSETARMLFGADRPDGGVMRLDGRPFAPRQPADAVRAGIALVPEERRSEGLILEKSVAFNATLAVLEKLTWTPRVPLVSMTRRRALAAQLGTRLMLRAASTEMAVGRLSGGNQQKVVLAKWLATRPRVLILDEPTRGVDVAARAEIHRFVRELADTGVAVLVISSEPDELPDMADRVLVMVEGRIAAELVGDAITRAEIVAASYETTAGETLA